MTSVTKNASPLVAYAAAVIADAIIRMKQKAQRRKRYLQLADRTRDPAVQRYCDYNRNVYAHTRPSDKSLRAARTFVIMDCFPIPVWVAANSILANCLAQRHGADICSYGDNERDAYTDELYNSFNCKEHFVIALGHAQRARRRALFLSAIRSVKTKHDLFALEIDGVQIGDEIYETYLRQFSKPTVDVNSLRCWYSIFVGLTYFVFFESFFKQHTVAATVLSHDIYTATGIPAKISWKHGVPVFLANGHEMKKTFQPNDKNQEFRRYAEYFARLSDQEQQAGITWARQQLAKRLAGEVGVDMSYSTKSAYIGEKLPRQTAASKKIKIVIATHCFFDNPRAYGGSLFIDYREWLAFLGKISEITDYEWYIKTHRDYLPGTLETLREIISEHPRLRLIDANTSWHQLRDEGVSVALTSYGSIGHELPLLGIRVINGGYNPHIAYSFNSHPQTLDEYRQILLDLAYPPQASQPEMVYEFYFVHHRLAKQGGFLFETFDDMGIYVIKDVHSTVIFERVVDGGEQLRQRACSIVNSFIASPSFSVAEMFLEAPRAMSCPQAYDEQRK